MWTSPKSCICIGEFYHGLFPSWEAWRQVVGAKGEEGRGNTKGNNIHMR